MNATSKPAILPKRASPVTIYDKQCGVFNSDEKVALLTGAVAAIESALVLISSDFNTSSQWGEIESLLTDAMELTANEIEKADKPYIILIPTNNMLRVGGLASPSVNTLAAICNILMGNDEEDDPSC